MRNYLLICKLLVFYVLLSILFFTNPILMHYLLEQYYFLMYFDLSFSAREAFRGLYVIENLFGVFYQLIVLIYI